MPYHKNTGEAVRLLLAQTVHVRHVLANRLVDKIADLLPRLDHVIAHPQMKICFYIDGSPPASLFIVRYVDKRHSFAAQRYTPARLVL